MNKILDKFLTGKFKGKFTDVNGQSEDILEIISVNGNVLGCSVVSEKERQWSVQGIVNNSGLVILDYYSTAGSGKIMFFVVTSNELIGTLTFTPFESVEKSCSNYALERIA